MSWPPESTVRDGTAVLDAAAGELLAVLPDVAWTQDGSGSGAEGPWVERRWLTGGGLTVVVTAITPPAGASAVALTAVMGRTLGRYRRWFAGTIEFDVAPTGTVLGGARLCRMRITSNAGEPLVVSILAGLVGDGVVLILETAHAEAVGDLRAPEATDLLGRLSRPSVTS